MPVFLTELFKCSREGCPFTIDCDPYEEGWAKKHFPEIPGLEDGRCPNCRSPLGKVTNPDQLQETHVISLQEIEAMLVPVLQNGRPVMVQTGEKQQLNPETGQMDIVPVFGEQTRPLTDAEYAAEVARRDQALDTLSAVAVSEVDQG
jgi:hypothetical protein